MKKYRKVLLIAASVLFVSGLSVSVTAAAMGLPRLIRNGLGGWTPQIIRSVFDSAVHWRRAIWERGWEDDDWPEVKDGTGAVSGLSEEEESGSGTYRFSEVTELDLSALGVLVRIDTGDTGGDILVSVPDDRVHFSHSENESGRLEIILEDFGENSVDNCRGFGEGDASPGK